MWPMRRVAKYSFFGATGIGTALSLHSNDYNINSIGIVRLARAAYTVFEIGVTYKTKLYYQEWDKKSPEYAAQKSIAHKLAAEKLLELCCTNKGVYIKVGQHIGALEYLLPREFVQTMKILHSNAPQNPVSDLFKVIKQDLKKNPEDLFESFDEKPLGTASLAQVHRATLKNGQVVAVKVQHPYVKGNSIVDMTTMDILCRIMGFVFPDFQMQWLAEETKKNLPIELDFIHEGRNAEKSAELFADYKWLRIPKIYWELSTPRILVMEYLVGGQVNDIDYIRSNKIDCFDVSSKLGQLYSNMIFLTGFVHSDPHPGNILVHKTKKGATEIILLDHGLYANLTNKFRYDYSQLWLSILKVDRKAMRYHSGNLGIYGDLYGLFACMVTGRPWESVVAGIDKVAQNENEKELLQKGTSMVLPHISDILAKVDRQMLLILKTNDLIRGIETSLETQNRMTAFWVMSKFCIKSVYSTEIEKAKTHWQRFSLSLSMRWDLFKLNCYYLYRGLINLSLLSTIKMLL